jgi:hypothetical protein
MIKIEYDKKQRQDSRISTASLSESDATLDYTGFL